MRASVYLVSPADAELTLAILEVEKRLKILSSSPSSFSEGPSFCLFCGAGSSSNWITQGPTAFDG